MWDSKPKKITSVTFGLEAKIALTIKLNNFSQMGFFFFFRFAFFF